MNLVAEPVHHVPVLASVVADLAAGCRRAVDATVGGGGHAALLIEAGADVLAFDRDPQAVELASARLAATRATVKLGSFAGSSRTSYCWIWVCRPISSTIPAAAFRSAAGPSSTCG
jgi:16S rRNA C1402 N4-methylase RsmH